MGARHGRVPPGRRPRRLPRYAAATLMDRAAACAGQRPPPCRPRGDADPLLLRGGSAGPARGGGARRGRAGRSTSSPCDGRATRPRESIDGVHVRRLGVQRHQGAGLGTYLREYLSFLVRAGWALTRAHPRAPVRGSSRSTRCPTSSSSPRCRCGWPGCRSSSTSTRRCRSSSGSRFRGRAAASCAALLRLQERAAIRFAQRGDDRQRGARPIGCSSSACRPTR